MKAKYEDFLEGGKYGMYEGNKDAEYIFESILSRDDSIIAMVDASEAGRPALGACIEEVEKYYDSKVNPIFDLKDNYTKQALGYMVKIVLDEFGYTPDKQKNMPKDSNARYLSSASSYKKTHKGTMKITKKIEIINQIS